MPETGEGVIKKLEDETFKEGVAQGVTLVDFYADWCGPCRMMNPILEELALEMKGKAVVAKVDTDQSQKISAELQVTSIPTIILFKDGAEAERVVGVRAAEDLRALIESAL